MPIFAHSFLIATDTKHSNNKIHRNIHNHVHQQMPHLMYFYRLQIVRCQRKIKDKGKNHYLPSANLGTCACVFVTVWLCLCYRYIITMLIIIGSFVMPLFLYVQLLKLKDTLVN